MAISVDWGTQVITVPKADTSLVSVGPPEIRSLNVDTFRLELKALEADPIEGVAYPKTHVHNSTITIGGVTLARVVEIVNGYTVTFENGSYAVNLEGANQNIGDVLNFNSVQIRSSNSAGLTYSKQVEDQSFLDQRITIDTVNGQSGTAFPLGTPGSPVNNLADAQSIINTRTLPKRLFIQGDLTIGASDNIDHHDIQGSSSHGDSGLVFVAGCSTSHATIRTIDITGTPSGELHVFDAVATNLTGFEGSLLECGISGTITLANVDPGNIVSFIKCHSMVVGANTPTIDANSIADLDLNVRGYYGGLEIQNFTLASMEASVDSDAIRLVIGASNTNGTIVVRGVGVLEDDAATATVSHEGFVHAEELEDIWKYNYNKRITDPVTGIETIYEADDTTAASTAQVYEDAAGTQTYRGQGAERRERRT